MCHTAFEIAILLCTLCDLDPNANRTGRQTRAADLCPCFDAIRSYKTKMACFGTSAVIFRVNTATIFLQIKLVFGLLPLAIATPCIICAKNCTCTYKHGRIYRDVYRRVSHIFHIRPLEVVPSGVSAKKERYIDATNNHESARYGGREIYSFAQIYHLHSKFELQFFLSVKDAAGV